MNNLEVDTIIRFEAPINYNSITEEYDTDKRKRLEFDVIHKTVLAVQDVLKDNPGYSLKITDDPHRREFGLVVGKWTWIIKLTDLRGSKYCSYFTSIKNRFELEDRINANLPVL